jgi:hypothetical protein
VTLGYNLPINTLGSWTGGAISSLRLYTTAQNLFTFTKYTGFDPEKGANGNPSNANLNRGTDSGTFPQARTFLFGLQVGF